MDQHDTPFSPEHVDEQVEKFLYEQAPHDENARTIHGLQRMYEDEQILSSVWQRLNDQASTTQQQHTTPYTQNKRKLRSKHMDDKQLYPRHTLAHRFSLLVAVLVVAIIAGSAFAIFSLKGRPGANGGASTNTSVASGGIYTSDYEHVYRLDKQTREEIWHESFPDEDPHGESPITLLLNGDTLYVNASPSGEAKPGARRGFFALDASTGKQLWERSSVYWSSPFFFENTLYVFSVEPGNGDPATRQNQVLLAIDPQTGKEVKRYSTIHTGKLIDNVMYSLTGSSLGEVDAVKIPSGEHLWHASVDNGYIMDPQVVVDGIFYAVAYPGKKIGPRGTYIYAFNAETGEKLWRTQEMSDYVFELTVANNVIYAGSQNKTFYAYNARTGEQRWSVDIGAVAAEPVLVGNMLYMNVSHVNTSAGQQAGVMALDAATGQRKWYKEGVGGRGDGSEFSPLIIQDGVIYTLDAHSPGISALNTNGDLLWQKRIGESKTPDPSFGLSSLIVTP